MNAIELELKKSGEWIDTPTPLQVNEMYLRGISLLDLPRHSPKNRARRETQLKWNTLVNLFRQEKRAQAMVE
jgi:predicted secreted Zn-dependent protease